MSPLLDLLRGARVYELAQTYFPGMPHFPTHPPFLYSLTREHGEQVGPHGHSSSADAIAMGCHVGTHIDALSHFSREGRLFGGEAVVQSYSGGMGRHAADRIGPILRRAVLLDIAGLLQTAALAQDFEITPEHLDAAAEGLTIHAGDIVLLRTGWAAYYREPARFLSQGHSPGPSAAGARWLSERSRPRACGHLCSWRRRSRFAARPERRFSRWGWCKGVARRPWGAALQSPFGFDTFGYHENPSSLRLRGLGFAPGRTARASE